MSAQGGGVALLVGAGDAIGAAVARRFALGGFKVCIARRDAAKSQALIDELTKQGCEVRAYSVDARKNQTSKPCSPKSSATLDQSKSACSTVAQTSTSLSWRRPKSYSLRLGNLPVLRVSWSVARRLLGCSSAVAEQSCLPEPRQAFAVASDLRRPLGKIWPPRSCAVHGP